ncbi:MAG: hypothetical protein ACOC16_01530 [Nanoarchaeota archaeon]
MFGGNIINNCKKNIKNDLKKDISKTLLFGSICLGLAISPIVTNSDKKRDNYTSNVSKEYILNINENEEYKKNISNLEKMLKDDNLLYFTDKIDTYEKIFDNLELDVKGKSKHAIEVYNNYSDFLKNTSLKYDIPLDFFLGILSIEGAQMGQLSQTGASGYSQLFDSAIIDSFRYSLKKDKQKSDLFYNKASTYFSVDDAEVRRNILDEVKLDPKLNLEAGIAYCGYLKSIFNDLSLVAAGYQIGPSKLGLILHYHKGIQTKKWIESPIFKFAQDNDGKLKPSSLIAKNARKYVIENDLNIVDLLENSSLMKYYRRDFRGNHDRLEHYSLETLQCTNYIKENFIF